MLKSNLVLVVLCGFTMFQACGEERSETHYDDEIRNARAEKDREFKGDGSPIPIGEREDFSGLHYFPPDTAFVIIAQYNPVDSSSRVSLGTSTGETRVMERLGTLRFSVPGAKGGLQVLTLFAEVTGEGSSFLPIADATNGDQTYFAGRYLDIPRPEGPGMVALDFNNAYNPYCAYNEKYSCPLVPPENRLSVPIPVGERTWRD